MTHLLEPTHTCFVDSFDLVLKILQETEPPHDDVRLVHGLCEAPDSELYAHAWVEFEHEGEPYVLFEGILDSERAVLRAEHQEFYTEWRVRETVRYTVDQAFDLHLSTGYAGPWQSKYKAHCALPGEKPKTWPAGFQINVLTMPDQGEG